MADDTNYSIDLRTNNGLWARFAAWFAGGRLVTPDSGQINGPASASGRVGSSEVSDVRSMQVSAVWACVRILSTVTSSLPIDLYRHVEGRRTSLEWDHPLFRLIKLSPNQYMTANDFRKAMNTQLALFGNAYAYMEKNAAGDVISLMPLQAPNVEVRVDNGRLIYRVRRDDGARDFTADKIFHLKGFGTSGLVGLSPIANASRTLGVAIAMEDQQRDFYANGAKSAKILSVGDRVLSKEQRAQVEANFRSIAQGPMDERLWILEAGFSASDVQISPSDAETLASRKFQVAEIARIFGVPPYLIGDVEKSTSWGSGIEQQNLSFIQYTLMDYLKSWEQGIQRSLVKDDDRRRGSFIEAQHNLEMLLRGDSTARAAFLTQMVQSGIYSINEARHLENKPPVPGGDENRIQVQNQPLTQPAPTDAPPSGASS